MRAALCNEAVAELSFERQCALAAGLGHRRWHAAGPFERVPDGAGAAARAAGYGRGVEEGTGA